MFWNQARPTSASLRNGIGILTMTRRTLVKYRREDLHHDRMLETSMFVVDHETTQNNVKTLRNESYRVSTTTSRLLQKEGGTMREFF